MRESAATFVFIAAPVAHITALSHVITIEISCIINAMHFNHPETIPATPHSSLYKNCLPQNQSLTPEGLRTALYSLR